ncbi:MAG TPA: four helix bundle protein [Candidatus Aenigmarchaeota archaeon]|nr:four helix bundle protein [Candidatus Aenigmarchaeota archaeon]
MKLEKFEDLNSWQEARLLNNMVYKLTQKLHKADFDLMRQMRRCSISIMANIAEGFGRYRFKDKKQFFTMARGSIAELKSHCYAALDLRYFTKEEFTQIYKQSETVGKLISGMIRATKTNEQ